MKNNMKKQVRGERRSKSAVPTFWWLILIIAIFVAIFLYKEKNAITVTTNGFAQLNANPDKVVVYIQAQTIDKTAQDATSKNARVVDDLTLALLRLGFTKEEIQTEQFSIYPNYDWQSGNQDITGYTATQNIKVETSDFGKVGKIVDSAVSAGALINYINFELSVENQNKYKAQLLEQATLDGMTKADSIARGLGKSVRGVVSVSTNDYGYYPVPIYRSDSGKGLEESVASATINPSQLDLNAAVTVTFKI